MLCYAVIVNGISYKAMKQVKGSTVSILLCTFKKALFLIMTACSKLLWEWSLMSSVWWDSKNNFEHNGGVKNMLCIKYGYQVFNVKFRSKIQHYNIIVKRNKHIIIGNQCLRGDLVGLGHGDMPLLLGTFMGTSLTTP